MFSEMGMSYEDFLNLSWRAVDYYIEGFNRRIQRQWDYTRHLMSASFNSTGMSKKVVKTTDIMKLPLLDTKVVIDKPLGKVSKEKLTGMLSVLNKT